MKIIQTGEYSVEQKRMYGIINRFRVHLRQQLRVPKQQEIIYQYTNIDALYNGIIAKETTNDAEKICLWASSFKYMNDPKEIKIGFERIADIFSHIIEQDAISQPVELKDDDYFITSFSTAKDSLPMWSMYGKNGSGIALGFDKKFLQKKDVTDLVRCVYLNEEMERQVDVFCKAIESKEKLTSDQFSLIFMMIVCALALNEDKEQTQKQVETLMPFLLFMLYAKHPAYEYEQEIRLLTTKDKNTKIEYRLSNNLVIPYVKNYFPKEALKEILVGPTNDMDRTIKSVRTYLDHLGFNDVKVIPSQVPYR